MICREEEQTDQPVATKVTNIGFSGVHPVK